MAPFWDQVLPTGLEIPQKVMEVLLSLYSGYLRPETLGMCRDIILCVDSAVLRKADEDGRVFPADLGKMM
jgi:hypothetical protein